MTTNSESSSRSLVSSTISSTLGKSFSVKVYPKSGKSEVEGVRNGVLIVRLKSAPERGKANKELLKVLAEYWGVSTHVIHIVKGIRSQQKIVQILTS